MLKKIILFSLIFTFALNAQFRRIALLEEATNASCGPCAANNPTLQEFVEHSFGGVITVRYHAWWPGSDPMYSHNATENRARIQYYGINGVPGYTMDGVFKGVPSSSDAMRSEMEADIAEGSPLWIEVNRTPSQDSVIFSVKIIAGAEVIGANLRLRNAIIERRKVYATPPGSNGERIFNDVFRKMLPNTDGEALTSFAEDDTLTYEYAYPIDSEWNADDLAVVSWVQDDGDKKVIQANIDIPTFFTKSDAPAAELVESGETVTKNFTLINSNPDTLRVYFDNSEDIPSDWSVSFEILDSSATTELAVVPPRDSLQYRLTISVGEEKGTGMISIYPRNYDDPYQYGYSVKNTEILPNGNILLVDADGGKRYELYYKVAFQQSEAEYTMLDRGIIPALTNDLLAYDWDAVYWNTAWGFPAFTLSEVSFLESYLDNGGNLFIAGQDIGWDIFDASGSSGFEEARSFYQNYLGARYLADNSNSYSLSGMDGDPITDGLSFNVSAIHQRYPESIRANGTGVSIILKYANGLYGAVKKETETYKTVYLGVGLEQVSTESARVALVHNSLVWFGAIIGVEEEAENVADKFVLEQNYPNPFNPTTTIKYSIPKLNGVEAHGRASLRIYNILGEEIVTLVNQKQAPGNYTVQFDASNLPSGVYFYTLRVGDFVATKKMILMK